MAATISTLGAAGLAVPLARLPQARGRRGSLSAGAAAAAAGAVLAASVSGSNAFSGMAATMSTLGAAVLAVPLARLAQARGRRVSLSAGAAAAAAGAVLAITAAAVRSFPLLLLALLMLGAAAAVNLQARFAATDLAADTTRARDLSLVVWSTTVGAVLGPNLFEPGEALGAVLGLPPLSGAFVFSVLALAAAAAVFAAFLRPDPLLTALARSGTGPRTQARTGGWAVLRTNPPARFAVAATALSHATMVALMSMTPVHLHEHGASLSVVGLTISLHVAGMYALSPVFGWLADRAGRMPAILLGQALLLAALVLAWSAPGSRTAVTACLVLLGLGWSASVVSGSALVAEAVDVEHRAAVQGTSDLAMNAAGAVAGAVAGPVLAAAGYSGLGQPAMVLVALVAAWAAAVRNRPRTPRPG
ncbi:MFS transporter [Arthrobacter deserti]|uniref:MFS transporter n=1 Tax=Arthrobacter deserti TaxID=1742687 RepID=A0ABX1JKL9_9MICC|nr:MFS transporter [Arthrobacter deserti]